MYFAVKKTLNLCNTNLFYPFRIFLTFKQSLKLKFDLYFIKFKQQIQKHAYL